MKYAVKCPTYEDFIKVQELMAEKLGAKWGRDGKCPKEKLYNEYGKDIILFYGDFKGEFWEDKIGYILYGDISDMNDFTDRKLMSPEEFYKESIECKNKWLRWKLKMNRGV